MSAQIPDTTAAKKRLALMAQAPQRDAVMTLIQQAVVACGTKIIQVAETTPHDIGRLIHTMDMLDLALHTAQQATGLPHVKLPVAEDKMSDV